MPLEHAAYKGFADLYDSLMTDVDYDAWATYLLGFLRAYLPAAKTPSVADVACGTGAIGIRLHALGCQVTGLDLSADMLRVAQGKARRQGLSIPFIQQDMRSLQLHKPVDAITVCCDGLNYLTSIKDAARFFAAAYQALKPGGLLLFDISSAYKLTHVLDGNTFGEVTDDLAYIWQNAFDPATRLLEMTLAFFLREGALYRRFDETHVQRAHTRAEIESALQDAGFITLGCYAAFTDADAAEDTERIQWIAKRFD